MRAKHNGQKVNVWRLRSDGYLRQSWPGHGEVFRPQPPVNYSSPGLPAPGLVVPLAPTDPTRPAN